MHYSTLHSTSHLIISYILGILAAERVHQHMSMTSSIFQARREIERGSWRPLSVKVESLFLPLSVKIQGKLRDASMTCGPRPSLPRRCFLNHTRRVGVCPPRHFFCLRYQPNSRALKDCLCFLNLTLLSEPTPKQLGP